MTDQVTETTENRRWKWSSMRSIILIVVLILTLSTLMWIRNKNYFGIPRGSLLIESPPGVDIYINETYLGTGRVEVEWHELFSEPLVTPRSSSENLTATMISGEGSNCVWKGKSTGDMVVQFLNQRVDGQLDHVWVIDEPYGFSGKYKPFFVPIRLRSKQNFFADYPEIGVGARQGFKIGSFSVGETLEVFLTFPSTTPPSELTDEIVKNGLWTPETRKN